MSIELRFLGLCMFRRPQKGESFMSVLLPNALNPDGRPHIDGSPAKPHYAYFFAPESATSGLSGNFDIRDGLVIAALRGTTIEFGTTGGPPTTDDLTDLADFSKFAECLDMNPEATPAHPAVLAAVTPLHGGSMRTAATSRIGPWIFNDTLWPGHTYRPDLLAWEIRWDTGLDRIEIRLTADDEKERRMTVDAEGGDVTITLGNVCEPDPAQWDHLPETPCPGGETVTDDDFKWLYRLFEPCGGKTWKEVLDGHLLPAPTISCGQAAVRGVSTPTCYGGGCC